MKRFIKPIKKSFKEIVESVARYEPEKSLDAIDEKSARKKHKSLKNK